MSFLKKSLWFLLVGTTVSCGSKGHNSKPPFDAEKEELLKKSEFSLKLDQTNMPGDPLGGQISWTARVSTNREGDNTYKDYSLERLSNQLADIKVKAGDAVSVYLKSELVVNDETELLLTNDKDEAYRSEKTKSAWEKNCNQLASPEFKIDITNLRSGRYSIDKEGMSVSIKVPICIFLPIDVPIIKVNPYSGVKLHNVTFRCEADNDTSLYLFNPEKPVCKYGYRSVDGSVIDNEVPLGTDLTKEFRPEIEFSFLNEFGRDQFTLHTYWNDMSQLPRFATKDRGCNKVEFVTYELANPSKEYRFMFEDRGSGWVSLTELGKRPGISKPAKMEYFLHCFWRGSADESTAKILN